VEFVYVVFFRSDLVGSEVLMLSLVTLSRMKKTNGVIASCRLVTNIDIFWSLRFETCSLKIF
jgi:hypothetical protein